MRIVPALLALTLMTSCVAPPAAPPPPVAAQPRPAAPPPPVASAAPLPTDWRDWPLTPGDWRYERTSFGALARFGAADATSFTVECSNDRRVHLEFPALPGGPFAVRTSTISRTLPVTLLGDPPAGVGAALTPTDPLLDAIAFSRGRWTIEQPGRPPLVLPAYAEVARVIEDCRG